MELLSESSSDKFSGISIREILPSTETEHDIYNNPQPVLKSTTKFKQMTSQI